jgi:hypothetical protein
MVAIGRKSRYRPIWNAFTNGQIQLIISEEIVHDTKKSSGGMQPQGLLN